MNTESQPHIGWRYTRKAEGFAPPGQGKNEEDILLLILLESTVGVLAISVLLGKCGRMCQCIACML